jgi:hypothetical protein
MKNLGLASKSKGLIDIASAGLRLYILMKIIEKSLKLYNLMRRDVEIKEELKWLIRKLLIVYLRRICGRASSSKCLSRNPQP